MAIPPQAYPWYGLFEGDEIEQGDILENCPVFLPPADLVTLDGAEANFIWEERDLIVLSQSCDLVKGREKLDDVLLCSLSCISDYREGELSKPDGKEAARKGNRPAVHMLSASEISSFEREARIVEFKRVYSLPIGYVRNRLHLYKHLRLMPPYREHLSQAFARFFMRVGLPVNIPPFK